MDDDLNWVLMLVGWSGRTGVESAGVEHAKYREEIVGKSGSRSAV